MPVTPDRKPLVGTTGTKPAGLLSEAAGIRIAILVVAAPIACCAVGLLVLVLLKHRQATLAARYAAMKLVAFPLDPAVDPPSFLHLALPTQDILARNPAQWSMIIATTSFVVVPIVLIGLAAMLYGLKHRNRVAMFNGAVPVAILAWMSYASVTMTLSGRVMVLDGAQNSLVLNGSRAAALSDVAGFAGRSVHHAKGGSDILLSAVMRNGPDIPLQGPDARADMVELGDAMTVMLHRLRHDPPASAAEGCRDEGCVALTTQQMQVLTARIGSVLGAPDAAASATPPAERLP